MDRASLGRGGGRIVDAEVEQRAARNVRLCELTATRPSRRAAASTACAETLDGAWNTTSLETNRVSPRGGMPVNPALPGNGRCVAEPALRPEFGANGLAAASRPAACARRSNAKPSPATLRQNTAAHASRPTLAASRLRSRRSIRCDIGQNRSALYNRTSPQLGSEPDCSEYDALVRTEKRASALILWSVAKQQHRVATARSGRGSLSLASRTLPRQSPKTAACRPTTAVAPHACHP